MNYYLIENKCGCCERYDKRHIGKSSAGWVFSLHIYPDENIKNWHDWEMRLDHNRNEIYNEYDEHISFNEMIDIITNRSHPRGLMRTYSTDTNYGFAGNGEGSYDYFNCEFS